MHREQKYNNMQHNYAAHNTRYNTTPHTHRTQFAHNPAQYRYNNTHKPQHRTAQNTEYTSSTYDLHKYSFDFYHLQQYIKKRYNIAIYRFYTFWSPY